MKQKMPNIILIVLDTVGAKHMSLYGYPRPTTPNIDRLAAKCTVYHRCFAPSSWTMPSHASMFTGLYPAQHGAYEGKFSLNENIQNVVSILKGAGYRTFGVSSNGLVSPESGLCSDFDFFQDFAFLQLERFQELYSSGRNGQKDDFSVNISKTLTIRETLAAIIKHLVQTGDVSQVFNKCASLVKRKLQRRGQEIPSDRSSTYTEKTLSLFKDILQQNSSPHEPPFFLFVNIMEAHGLYRPPLKWRKNSHWYDKQLYSTMRLYRQRANSTSEKILAKLRNLYDDEILYLDSIIGKMWEGFEKSADFDNTVFILTSDHGEHFGEKGFYEHNFSLYNELLWVPLLVRFPEGLKPAGSEDRLVSLNDLYSTILDLAHSPWPRPDTSVSLLNGSARDLLMAQMLYPEMWHKSFRFKQEVSQANGRHFSPAAMTVITDTGMKIIENRDGGLEIYHLGRDMDETENLAPGLSPEALANFRTLLEMAKEETGYLEAREEIAQKPPRDPRGRSGNKRSLLYGQ